MFPPMSTKFMAGAPAFNRFGNRWCSVERMICQQFRGGIDQPHCPLVQFAGVSVSKQEMMWEMLMKLDNNSSKGVWSTVWMCITITGWGNRKYAEGEEIRTENCKKNKNTKPEKFQVTFSKSAGMQEMFITAHSSSFRHYACKTQEARTEILQQ